MSRPLLPKTDPKNWDAFVKDWIPALREIRDRSAWDSFTWNPPNVAANTTVSTVLTTTDAPEVIGLRPEMIVAVTAPSDIADGLLIRGWCATADTLTVSLTNVTGSDINQASGTWSFLGVRP